AILAVLYRSYALPLIVMMTVPLAAVGAFGTLFVLNALRGVWPAAAGLQNQTLNLYSMLGIVMLVGLVAKNGILLIEYSERAFRRGRSALDAVCQAARVRFRPIVMTTFAMIAGMLPLALGDTIGAEYRRALGTVVIGGLTTSLLLTLFVVPIVYVAYRGAAAGRVGSRAALSMTG
ncbi:MAG: efflux RND transporter permease subunit, partial [Candidatus Eremiobacteraeota bacterium]|nr:efflux RND transporter permease subunit [Candidatus Eremiobacteraeota bacterium]